MDFAAYLLERGLVTDKELVAAEEFYRDQFQVPISRLSMSTGKMSAQDVADTLERQKETGEEFGEAAVRLGTLTAKDLIELVKLQRADATLLGEVLVKLKFLDRRIRDDALANYLQTQTPR